MNIIKKAAKPLCFFGALIVCLLVVSSGDKIVNDRASVTEKDVTRDTVRVVSDMDARINARIFNLPKVHVLPMDFEPSPKPDSTKFNEDTYEDETISVKCWHERIQITKKRTVTANFADITIAHPTQLRTALSNGKFGVIRRVYASKMAEMNNAVIAINGDYYNFRPQGVIVRQGRVFRTEPMDIDGLFINADGDFVVMNDKKAVKSGFVEKNQLYQAFAFGPVLVKDGEPVQKQYVYDSVECDPRAQCPRTAIGQLGKLHYLLCTVDGRSNASMGVTTNELAVVMADKQCITAYNLDGGQSSVMIFNNGIYNVVSGGGERIMSDIIYFATALPES